MTTPVSARSILSGPEVEQAIRSISDAGWHRLRRVARRYSFGRLNADDLLYDALSRTLEGRRTCPADVDVVRVLAEAIRSIASSSFKAAARHPELHTVDEVELQGGADTDCEGENPEQKMISDEEADRIRTAIVSLFNDDENAQMIVEGEMDGMPREELSELTGLYGQAFDSKRRLIRRRINGAFPEGWKS